MEISSRLSDDSSTNIEEKILGDHRFLDIRSYFNFDFSIFSSAPGIPEHDDEAVLTFKLFKRLLDSRQSKLAKSFSKIAGSLGKTRDLDRYSQFLMQLPASEIKIELLLKQVNSFEKFAKDCINDRYVDSQSLSSIAIPALIQPIYYWSNNLDNEQQKILMQRFETLIQSLDKILPASTLLSGSAEFKSYILFAYVLLGEICKTGLSSGVFCYHLIYFRKQSLTHWLNIHPQERLLFSVISLHVLLRFYKIDEPFSPKYGFSHNTFSDLHSLLNDAHNACNSLGLITTGQVFMWLLERVELEALGYSDLAVGRRALKGLTPGEKSSVVDLVKRFSSYRIPVTAERMEHFLVQFKTTARIRSALKLLSHLKFYPLWQLGEAIETLLKQQSDEFGKIVVSPLGDRTGSTAIINYLVSHSTLNNIVFADDLSHALKLTKTGGRIYFVDDCALSGTQSIHIMQELMGERLLKPHHTRHCEPLSSAQQNTVCKRTLVFTYCLACDIAVERMTEELSKLRDSRIKFEILYAIPEPSKSKAFSSASSVPWESMEERNELKQFCSEIGYDLLGKMAEKKEWDDDRRVQSSLGFSDFQRLLVFPYSVPKTTLPILWLGQSSEIRWTPLFPVID